MKLKWNSQFKKAKEEIDWAWWLLFGTIIITVVLVILRMSGKI